MKELVRNILLNNKPKPQRKEASAFAPSNIALCKYWGKRDDLMNLPHQSSLSISLGNKGAHTKIAVSENAYDQITLNGSIVDGSTLFAKRLIHFLDLFRQEQNIYFNIETVINIPVAAGVASSACGFAALTKALNNLYQWNLSNEKLSILARLGSGSACRSLWHGFVMWQAGVLDNGMDSYGVPLPYQWPELRIGLFIISNKRKSLSSREAMQQSVQHPKIYKEWVIQAEKDFQSIYNAIKRHDFQRFAENVEANAQILHVLIQKTNPNAHYSLSETNKTIQKIKTLRKNGLPLYYTQDAGPNLKLIFLKENVDSVSQHFPNVFIIDPFAYHNPDYN